MGKYFIMRKPIWEELSRINTSSIQHITNIVRRASLQKVYVNLTNIIFLKKIVKLLRHFVSTLFKDYVNWLDYNIETTKKRI